MEGYAGSNDKLCYLGGNENRCFYAHSAIGEAIFLAILNGCGLWAVWARGTIVLILSLLGDKTKWFHLYMAKGQIYGARNPGI